MRHLRSTPRSLSSLSRAGILRPSLALTSCCVLWTLLGCSSSTEETPAPVTPSDSSFESADPGAGGPPGRGVGVVPGGSNDGAAGPTAPPSGNPTAGESDGDGAGRAIEEADIIKMEGTTLYALSQYGGLSVIDASRRDRLQLVGRHKITATPFEMYVRDGVVMALYNGYGEYSVDPKTQQWSYHQTSYVIAIDARVPAATTVIGRFAVPGSISDSRIVGDVLYVAAFENGSCWGCGTAPRTNVISLNVRNPAAISKVDEISFAERLDTGYSWKRSVTATDQRLYIAGPTWGPNEPIGSTIQVVDISDRAGNLEEGATVKVDGQIESRWQMDEDAGVLRVVSQAFNWRTDTVPKVQTFQVASSSDIRPLGQVSLVIPRNERLRSARFDGPRGYAITALQDDPLFTIDLSNPRLPRQAGELVMPGWVYHMEPQGERLLGLGFDQGNAAGALTVSLFDVSNLATPTMLSRVNFGGDWASLAEDQDRIHKAFNVLPDAGLLLVPFSGWSNRTTAKDCGIGSSFQSGVQLIDWADDQLALRGVAPAKGQARRGFIHDERLFTMSDERIEAFDISDRDTPLGKASLSLAQIVNHSAVAGDRVVRIGHDWWTNSTELDVTSVNAAQLPSAYGRVQLPELDPGDQCYSSTWLGDVYSSANAVHLMYQRHEYFPFTGGSSKESTKILSVDTQDPSAPKVVGSASLDFTPQYSSYGGVWDSGKPTVMVGSTMVIANRRTEWNMDYTKASVAETNLKLVDLQDPLKPVVSTIQLPRFIGATGLLVSGNVVATSHFEPASGSAATPSPDQKVRFYLDRLDLSDPAQPRLAPSVNIPGSLLAFDAASGHAITVDYAARRFAGQTAQQCAERYSGWLEYPSNTNIVQDTVGLCHSMQQTLHLVAVAGSRATIVDSHSLELGEAVGSTALADDRLFVLLARSGGYYGRGGGLGIADSAGGPGYYGFSSQPLTLLTLGGIRSGTFAAGRLAMEGGDSWGGYLPLQAAGERAVLATGFRGKLFVVDAADAAAPTLLREVETFGYVQDLDIIGQTAVASMGHDGVQTIRLDD